MLRKEGLRTRETIILCSSCGVEQQDILRCHTSQKNSIREAEQNILPFLLGVSIVTDKSGGIRICTSPVLTMMVRISLLSSSPLVLLLCCLPKWIEAKSHKNDFIFVNKLFAVWPNPHHPQPTLRRVASIHNIPAIHPVQVQPLPPVSLLSPGHGNNKTESRE